jgi:hypothetical protein
MTKEERKARRLEKRAARRESRKLRKIKAKAFKAAMAENSIAIDIDNKPNFVEVFNQFWPLAKPAFEFVITLRITKEKVDVILNTIIDLGDRISNGEASAEEETEFIGLLISVWSGVKMGLEMLQIVTGKKADDVIDNIIDTGEYILGEQDDT